MKTYHFGIVCCSSYTLARLYCASFCQRTIGEQVTRARNWKPHVSYILSHSMKKGKRSCSFHYTRISISIFCVLCALSCTGIFFSLFQFFRLIASQRKKEREIESSHHLQYTTLTHLDDKLIFDLFWKISTVIYCVDAIDFSHLEYNLWS